MGKSLIVIWLSVLLSGCALWDTPPPEVVYKTKPIICNVTKPVPIVPLDINISVVQDKKEFWWVALDDKSYSNLAINNKEVIRYIKDMQLYADTLSECIKKGSK